MIDDDFTLGLVVFSLGLVLAMFGVMHFAMDFRHFTEIAKQCDKQGYIQNETTRIQCRVEKP